MHSSNSSDFSTIKVLRYTVLQHHIDTGIAAHTQQQAKRVPLLSRETMHTLNCYKICCLGISSHYQKVHGPHLLYWWERRMSLQDFAWTTGRVNEVTHKDPALLPG